MGGRIARVVLRNRGLSRIVLAFGLFNLADWARWLAILVYAFERGGAAEAGAISLLQLLPAAIVAPLAANIGDRFSRERMLQLAYWSQALALGATGGALLADAPSWLVYAFAILAVMATSLTRPAHASLLPGLTVDPAELTAANVASGWMEGLGILAGPAVAGLVLGVAEPGMVFLLAAALMAAAGALAGGLRAERVGSGPQARRSALDVRELLAGFSALRQLAGPRTVVLVFGASALLWGAVDVLNVVLAIDVMHIGPSGAGALGVALGLGGLAGAAVSASLVGRPTLTTAFVAGLLLWGVPILGIALLPVPWVALPLLASAGAGRSLLDVAGRTLLQRASPDEVLSRIFGILEGSFLGAFGLGSIAVAGLIAAFGPQTALVAAGLWLPIVALVAWGDLRSIDRSAVVPLERVALLRAIPMFAPLPQATIERLARALVPVRAEAGAPIIRQGEPGDRFYVIESGEVEFSIDGRPIKRDARGGSFGEIALLRDIPRTATVQAVTETRLLALERGPFLEAVTGYAASRTAADQLVAERLGA
jgi:MFS family permease